MTNERVKAVLSRVSAWPERMQEELATIALELEAEMLDEEYQPTPDELAAIDNGLNDDPAGEEEVESAFAAFRRA